jgi:hypothetical protein
MGPFALRSRFPETLRGKAAVICELLITLKRRSGFNFRSAKPVRNRGRPIIYDAAPWRLFRGHSAIRLTLGVP